MSVYVLISVGVGIWSFYESSRETYRQEKHRAETQQHQASRNIASECAIPDAPAGIVAECLAAQVETYEGSRNTNKDLQAQQDMAYWALWMFVASAAGVGVSVAGLILLLRSLRQTQEAISIDREVGHAQVRAYVSLDPKPFHQLRADAFPNCIFDVRNTGQSPAYNFKYVASIFLDDRTIENHDGDLVVPHADAVAPGTTIAANGSIQGDARCDVTMTQEVIESLMSDSGQRLYMACIITYVDVFKKPHKTRFCGYFGRVAGVQRMADGRQAQMFSWIMTPSHNDAD